jgi:hypothetical protein
MGSPAMAAGTIPLAMTQQVDINGKPLAGCLLYTYQSDTVSTPQNSFQDFGLTITNPNPLACDQTGRIPMFWLADGLIHFRLTDAAGTVVIDNTMQVLGPSSGGGGGGGSVDPTSVMSTGDIKFRQTKETLTGWVALNGLTIGSGGSGATGRANADTQALFIYLWGNCPDTRCAVSGGRGATGLADFNANKRLMLPDWRDKAPFGLDCMNGSGCLGGFLSGNITSGGSDTVDTGGAFGGGNNTAIAQANLPAVSPTFTGTNASWNSTQNNVATGTPLVTSTPGGGGAFEAFVNGSLGTGVITTSITPAGTISALGSGTLFPNVSAFILGSWYIKL